VVLYLLLKLRSGTDFKTFLTCDELINIFSKTREQLTSEEPDAIQYDVLKRFGDSNSTRLNYIYGISKKVREDENVNISDRSTLINAPLKFCIDDGKWLHVQEADFRMFRHHLGQIDLIIGFACWVNWEVIHTFKMFQCMDIENLEPPECDNPFHKVLEQLLVHFYSAKELYEHTSKDFVESNLGKPTLFNECFRDENEEIHPLAQFYYKKTTDQFISQQTNMKEIIPCSNEVRVSEYLDSFSNSKPKYKKFGIFGDY